MDFKLGQRLETEGLTLPLRPLARLAQDEERGFAGSKREEEEEWGKKKGR